MRQLRNYKIKYSDGKYDIVKAYCITKIVNRVKREGVRIIEIKEGVTELQEFMASIITINN